MPGPKGGEGSKARMPGRRARRDAINTVRPAPIFVLDNPQMGENIGAAARAMLNFGVFGLRLVNPRDGWPNPKAGALAAGASLVVDQARVYDSLAEALADCHYVQATTARTREMSLPILSPADAALALKPRIDAGQICAVVFGPERSGLTNDDVARADAIISIPVNPAFASINLAQSALIMAYEWAQADGRETESGQWERETPSTRENFDGLINHLYEELEATGYFFPAARRNVMRRNLRTIFTRAQLTENEVQTLRGVIKSLARKRGPKT